MAGSWFKSGDNLVLSIPWSFPVFKVPPTMDPLQARPLATSRGVWKQVGLRELIPTTLGRAKLLGIEILEAAF